MLNPCALVLLPLAVAIAAGVSAPTSPLVDLPTFVVVGGGFKGAFIAANLAQPGHNKVLLLESADKLVRLSEPARQYKQQPERRADTCCFQLAAQELHGWRLRVP
jgi:choline dehydrogenase-like flavoprotein